MTLAHQLAPSSLREWPASIAFFSPSWLKAYGYKLTATFLTPFFPTLAHPVFNSFIVYHFQKTGGRGVRSHQSPSLRSGLCALCVSAVSLLFPFLLLVSPLSSFPTSLLPREPSRGVAKTSRLSPFTATLTQRQGGMGCWSYLLSSLLAVGCQLLAFDSRLSPCPASRFPLKWGYPFPVITGENQ